MGELILKLFVENKDLPELKKRERYGIVSGIVGIICNIILKKLILISQSFSSRRKLLY